jgi:hypothetical protein
MGLFRQVKERFSFKTTGLIAIFLIFLIEEAQSVFY